MGDDVSSDDLATRADRAGATSGPRWWIGGLAGLACAVFGAVLMFRPFDSLTVLVAVVAVVAVVVGASELAESRRARLGWPGLVGGLVWISLGVVVIAWPGITVRALAVVVGVALVVGGLLDVVAGLRGSTDQRFAAVVSGAASAIFGVLAISWPSVTVLVVAVVFGFRLVQVGVRTAWTAWRGRHGDAPVRRHRGDAGRVRRFGHAVVPVVSLVVALGLAGLSAQLNRGAPVVDSFYDTPSDVPDQPGVLLDIEPFTRTIPDDARAWRILYTTTRFDGEPALASALVVVPAAPSAEPLPVIALAHGTTGVDRTCAPSVLPDPFAAGAFFALDRVIDEGWALVATDYVGLGTDGGHPYLVGEPAGRSVLDSVRAARQIDEIALADETAVWGHSQGGGAALWTGGLAPIYAPDIDVVGVAALAPASDLIGLAEGLGGVTAGSIFAAYLLAGYANAYDDIDVDDYVRPAARASFDATVGRCLAEPAALLSVIGAIALGEEMFSADLASGPLLDRLRENVPTLPIDAPLLLAQGEADQLVLPEVQARFVETRCAVGQPIDARTFPGLDHVPLVEPDSPLLPQLFEWTRSRFAGDAPTPTCGE